MGYNTHLSVVYPISAPILLCGYFRAFDVSWRSYRSSWSWCCTCADTGSGTLIFRGVPKIHSEAPFLASTSHPWVLGIVTREHLTALFFDMFKFSA
jgi:hypothetical protein